MLNFGIECEVAGGTSDVLDNLELDNLHGYHCECPRCDPHRGRPTWTAQEDCTADGEFISKILTYGTSEAVDAIDMLGDALSRGRAKLSTGQGLHIHVASDEMDRADVVHFWRLWFRYQDDIGRLAAGAFDNVRSYNAPLRFSDIVGRDEPGLPDFWRGNPERVYGRIGRPYSRASWVNPMTGHGTYEFRLWNTTRATWRIHLAVGVSVAIMAAAMDGVNVKKRDERDLYDVIGPYLNDKSTAAYIRAAIYMERAA